MWCHPVSDEVVNRARKAWLDAREALLSAPNNATRIRAESRTRFRLVDALEGVGVASLLSWERGENRPGGGRTQVPNGAAEPGSRAVPRSAVSLTLTPQRALASNSLRR
jgi:hypothetical protein